jgi:hypothetical protein
LRAISSYFPIAIDQALVERSGRPRDYPCAGVCRVERER